mmetsp:Transcript_7767/g.11285  ORF Transcript_7767/g.11285 Transcript_7767/m.11285 type:complete len:405 (+) Transcript_7767:176-1390(+)
MRWKIRVVVAIAALIKFKAASAFQSISTSNYVLRGHQYPHLESDRLYGSKNEKRRSKSNENEKKSIFSFRSKNKSEQQSSNSNQAGGDGKSDRLNFKNLVKKAFGRKGGSPLDEDLEKTNSSEKSDKSFRPLDNKLKEIRAKIEEDKKKREKSDEERRKREKKNLIEREKKRQKALKEEMKKQEEKASEAKRKQELLKRDKSIAQIASSKLKETPKSRTQDIRAKNETETSSKDKSGFNPVLGAQRFISNVYESTIGSRDQWEFALRKKRIDPGEVVPVNVAGLDLLIIASRNGEKIYCVANSCSHLGTPLETGPLQRRKTNRSTDSSDGCEDCIVCPLHQTAFSVETGEVNGPWCPYPPVIGNIMGTVKEKSPIATFEIRTRGKDIEVKLSSRIPSPDSESQD